MDDYQWCRKDGGVLHVHGNVKDTEEAAWIGHVTTSIQAIARSEGIHFTTKKLPELYVSNFHMALKLKIDAMLFFVYRTILGSSS